MNTDNEFRIISEPFQGSEQWLALRLTKITATDARIIMQVDPWKTKQQLYKEKIGEGEKTYTNKYMQRGLDLENGIRDYLSQEYGMLFSKKTVVRGWCLASLDALSDNGLIMCEIKCPEMKDHYEALKGQIPKKYYPQLQFTMHVVGLNEMYYESSLDGKITVTVLVQRNQEYIDDMLQKCWDFYECVQKKTPPPLDENDFIERDDEMWIHYAHEYQHIKEKIIDLEAEKERIKNHLIYLSMSHNSKGAGLRLQKVPRMGNVDYSKIEVLKDIDLEQYRKPSTSAWRITTE